MLCMGDIRDTKCLNSQAEKSSPVKWIVKAVPPCCLHLDLDLDLEILVVVSEFLESFKILEFCVNSDHSSI